MILNICALGKKPGMIAIGKPKQLLQTSQELVVKTHELAKLFNLITELNSIPLGLYSVDDQLIHTNIYL